MLTLSQSSWAHKCRALFRSKVDDFLLQTQHVNSRMVGQYPSEAELALGFGDRADRVAGH